MRVTALGCNGSITGERRTTSHLVDDDILIDADSGAGDLSMEQSSAIDTVFLTHSHLDHCCFLPMLADTADAQRSGHMTANLLTQGLRLLQRPVNLFVVYMEAGREEETMQEVRQAAGTFGPQMLKRGQVLRKRGTSLFRHCEREPLAARAKPVAGSNPDGVY